MELKTLQNKIGFNFKNESLIKEALTHRSYTNENAEWQFRNNERLEFLGDAVLELIVTEELFNRFPKKEEGELTLFRAALVNSRILSKIARSINLDKEILISRGELNEIISGGGEAILADGIEALIGALYLDQGYGAVYKFVMSFIMLHLEEVIKNGAKDAKSLIQEIAQEKYAVTPTYKVLDESGPAHQRTFRIGLYFGEEIKSYGSGNSKQNAELEAAEKLLEILRAKNFASF